jgi:hypothetical protein
MIRASVVGFVVEKAVLEHVILQYCPVSKIPQNSFIKILKPTGYYTYHQALH